VLFPPFSWGSFTVSPRFFVVLFGRASPSLGGAGIKMAGRRLSIVALHEGLSSTLSEEVKVHGEDPDADGAGEVGEVEKEHHDFDGSKTHKPIGTRAAEAENPHFWTPPRLPVGKREVVRSTLYAMCSEILDGPVAFSTGVDGVLPVAHASAGATAAAMAGGAAIVDSVERKLERQGRERTPHTAPSDGSSRPSPSRQSSGTQVTGAEPPTHMPDAVRRQLTQPNQRDLLFTELVRLAERLLSPNCRDHGHSDRPLFLHAHGCTNASSVDSAVQQLLSIHARFAGFLRLTLPRHPPSKHVLSLLEAVCVHQTEHLQSACVAEDCGQLVLSPDDTRALRSLITTYSYLAQLIQRLKISRSEAAKNVLVNAGLVARRQHVRERSNSTRKGARRSIDTVLPTGGGSVPSHQRIPSGAHTPTSKSSRSRTATLSPSSMFEPEGLDPVLLRPNRLRSASTKRRHSSTPSSDVSARLSTVAEPVRFRLNSLLSSRRRLKAVQKFHVGPDVGVVSAVSGLGVSLRAATSDFTPTATSSFSKVLRCDPARAYSFPVDVLRSWVSTNCM
jgi:hypothetical protein